MKITVCILAVLLAGAAACDQQAVNPCLMAYQQALTSLASNPSQWADVQTAACVIIRDFFLCLWNACPSAQSSIQQALSAFQTVFDECGFAMPGSPSLADTGFCALTGDPHVRSFNRKFVDCNLLNSEIVFKDGANTVTVTTDSNVGWPDKSLFATRSVNVTNTRTGLSYGYTAGGANFGTIPKTNGVTVNDNSVYDEVTKLRVRVEQLSDGVAVNPEYWINVYIRGALTGTSGVCAVGTCVSGTKRSDVGTTFERAGMQRAVDAVATCAAQTDGAGQHLSGQALKDCLIDVANTGKAGFSKSAASAQVELRLNGSSAVIAPLAVIIALCALLL